jgi:hypothetical protein
MTIWLTVAAVFVGLVLIRAVAIAVTVLMDDDDDDEAPQKGIDTRPAPRS